MSEKRDTPEKRDAPGKKAAGREAEPPLPDHVEEAFAAGGSVLVHSELEGTVFATSPEEIPADAFVETPQTRLRSRLVSEPVPAPQPEQGLPLEGKGGSARP